MASYTQNKFFEVALFERHLRPRAESDPRNFRARWEIVPEDFPVILQLT